MPYLGAIAEIIAGLGTLISDNNPTRGRHTDLVIAEGIVSEKGFWEREPGMTPYTNNTVGVGIAKFTFPSQIIPETPFPAFNGAVAALFATFTLNGVFSYLSRIDPSNAGTGTSSGGSGTGTLTIGTSTAEHIPAGAAIAITYQAQGPQSPNTTPGGISSITDDAGNTYVQIGTSVRYDTTGTGNTHNVLELWVAFNVHEMAAGQRIQIHTNAPSGGPMGFLFTGNVFAGIGALDTFNSATATASPVAQAAALAAASPGEVMLISYSDCTGAASVQPSPSTIVAGGAVVASDPVSHTAFSSELFWAPYPFSLAGINALADFWITSATQRLLALTTDGVLFKSSGGAFSSVQMATVMQDDAAMIVVGGQESGETGGKINRKAFVFDNGRSKIQVLTGDANVTTDFGGWNSSTNIPQDWTGGILGGAAVSPPRGGIIHKERLWCWATPSGPHNIYASSLGDQENFKNAVLGSLEYVQSIGVGTGIRIAAAASFKGMLFVFKYPRGIYFLDDTDVDASNWRWNPVTDAVGVCDSPYSVIVLDDDVLFMDANGHLNFLSAVTQQGVSSSDLTAALNLQQWTRDHINLGRLNRMVSCYYPAKKLAMIGLSSLTSLKNDLRLYLDFSNADAEGQVVRISYSYRDINQALSIRRDSTGDGTQKPILGDDTGIVWKMDQPGKTKTGFPGVGRAHYQYNRTDFSHIDPTFGQRRKLFDALSIQFKPVGSWNLSVDSIIDGRYQETLLFSMGSKGFILDSSHLDVDRLSGDSVSVTRRRMTGSGFWLSLGGFVTGEGQDFSIVKHYVNIRPGGEEQR